MDGGIGKEKWEIQSSLSRCKGKFEIVVFDIISPLVIYHTYDFFYTFLIQGFSKSEFILHLTQQICEIVTND